MKKNIALLAVLALVITFASCAKKSTDVNYTKLAEDSNIQQQMSADLTNNTNSQARGGTYSGTVNKIGDQGSYQGVLDTCAAVTLNTNGGHFPMVMHIDFGNGSCGAGLDGRTRKGVLDITFSGLYSTPGTVVTIVPTDYYVNGYKVEGTKTITNNGRNAANQLTFTETDVNGRITKPDGGVITWNSTRTNTWVSGEATTGFLGIWDDNYNITGSASGTISDGTDYNINITTPLESKGSCLWVVHKGALSYSLNGSVIATLDCGDGSCSSKYTLTYNGRTYTFQVY